MSTYRQRTKKYGRYAGSNSGNEECNLPSPAPDILTQQACYYCGTLRGDKNILPPVGNKIADGNAYYKEICEGNKRYRETGSTGYVSRGPSLYGLYLKKTIYFYEEHQDHAQIMQERIERKELQWVPIDPLAMHIYLYGETIGYSKKIMVIAQEVVNELENNLYEKGIYLPEKDYPTALKTKCKMIYNYLSKRANWNFRKQLYEIWQEESNETKKEVPDNISTAEEIVYPIDLDSSDSVDPFSFADLETPKYILDQEKEETDIPF
jgi:hypothetical protein